ncbi:MAG: MDR family oxidoreductase [Magnetospiraceae bacterium]
MADDTFRALVLDETDGTVTAAMKDLTNADLPAGDVTVRVTHTTLNYKDGLILAGQGRLVRKYPHVGGIDFAGEVESSDSPDYKPGDPVVLTGWRVGETHWGGYAGKARVKAEWLVPKPAGLSPAQCMAIGTAGFTAMLGVMALEDHGLTPQTDGEVLVTGAAGGVGSVAVAILSKLGYKVAASTGRAETHAYLQDLGATTLVDRAELTEPIKGPLGGERWAGAIDSVGGATLANVLATLKYQASCAAIGLASGPKLDTTVVPFLLRGVNLLGIDSVMCPAPRRLAAWNRLGADLPLDKLDAMITTADLADLPALGADILKGQIKGRLVVTV